MTYSIVVTDATVIAPIEKDSNEIDISVIPLRPLTHQNKQTGYWISKTLI